MVFIGLLLNFDPLLRILDSARSLGTCPVCDAQEMDLICQKYNPD
jgi:hypothetical protein